MSRDAWLMGAMFLASIAAAANPYQWRTSHAQNKDDRVVRDRLHARNNANHEDYSFLNAVGAVWPDDINNAAAGSGAATGFLIDRCHVLTSMHVVFTDGIVINPPDGKPVAFAVGQTEGETNRGALRGLKFLLHGTVTAHGDTIIVNHLAHDPENDWALIALATTVDDTAAPMTIAAVDEAQLPKRAKLSVAGFPTDHRSRRGDGFNFKDLWGSDGEVVGVVRRSTIGAVVETTIQVTRGNSGSPLYGDVNGQKHVVIGMVQSIRGNGIDATEDAPNTEVLFTPNTLASIGAARARTPCR
jgi:hypothetical protein